MTVIDPKTGVPIIGARDPEADKRTYIEAVATEKRALGEHDHDWIVLIAYALTAYDADRAATAKQTGVAASPAIPVIAETMVDDIGPLCRRCNQDYAAVKDAPCPGMPLEVYLASLDPETRAQVVERLASNANGEPDASVERSSEVVSEDMR